MATLTPSLKVTGAIAVSNGTSAATVYTAPATGYAIIQITTNSTNLVTINIAGVQATKITTQTPTSSYSPVQSQLVYVGPSQALSFTGAGGGSDRVNFTGVEFTNS